jgi:membrane-associated phospholipid phosphatase
MYLAMRIPRGYASVEAVRLRRLPVLFWLGLAGYIALTALVATGAMDSADRSVLDFCLDHRNPTIAAAADHFTDVLSPEADIAILLIGVGIRAWLRRRPAVVVPAILTVALMAGIVLTTKNALGRPLPGTPHLEHADGFPSGHTAMFLACFGTLVLLTTRRRRRRRMALLTVVVIGTVLVAASLVYDGFHWLTDTIASASLGAGLLSLLQFWLRRRTASRPSPTGTPLSARSAHRR